MTELAADAEKVNTTPQPIITDHKPSSGNKNDYYHATKTMRLFMSKQVIDGFATNPLLREMMSDFYDREKIAIFSEIQANTADAFSKQIVEAGEKSGYYDLFDKAFSIAKIEFSCLVRVAKVAFKNDSIRCETLRLYEKKHGKNGVVLEFMDNFYKALLNDREAINILTKYGYSEQSIIESRKKFVEANIAYSVYQKENAESIEATRIRDEKMAELDEWMYDYYALLKVAKIKRTDLQQTAQ